MRVLSLLLHFLFCFCFCVTLACKNTRAAQLALEREKEVERGRGMVGVERTERGKAVSRQKSLVAVSLHFFSLQFHSREKPFSSFFFFLTRCRPPFARPRRRDLLLPLRRRLAGAGTSRRGGCSGSKARSEGMSFTKSIGDFDDDAPSFHSASLPPSLPLSTPRLVTTPTGQDDVADTPAMTIQNNEKQQKQGPPELVAAIDVVVAVVVDRVPRLAHWRQRQRLLLAGPAHAPGLARAGAAVASAPVADVGADDVAGAGSGEEEEELRKEKRKGIVARPFLFFLFFFSPSTFFFLLNPNLSLFPPPHLHTNTKKLRPSPSWERPSRVSSPTAAGARPSGSTRSCGRSRESSGTGPPIRPSRRRARRTRTGSR